MYGRGTAPSSHPSRAHGDSTKSRAQQQPIPQITIAVMGTTGSGKTSFINIASGSSLRIGSSLESCTARVQLSDEFILDRRSVVLIDTPGFGDTYKSDTDILKSIAAFLATAYEAGSTLAGVIYIYRISDKQFSGIAARNFKMFRELCGDKTLKNVIFVTNMWGGTPLDAGEARELELTTNFFKPVLDKGAQLVRHHNTVQSAHNIIRSIMKNKPAALQIQRELVDQKRDIVHTSAGEVINKELNEQIRRHQEELKVIQEDMIEALKEKDEEMRQELEAETRKLQEQMDRMRTDLKSMASNYLEEKRKMEETMKQVEEQFRKGREKAEASYKQQMDNRNRRLRETAKSSAEIRRELEVETRMAREQVNSMASKKNYYHDGMAVFEVQGALFRVPKCLFEPGPGRFGLFLCDEKYEDSDERPISLPDLTVGEFRALIDFFLPYRCLNRKELLLQYWVNLLSISTKYELDLVRPVAIDGIEKYRPEIEPVEKYALAAEYMVGEWKASSFEMLCKRPDPLTVEDAEKLGVVIVTKVFRERERIRSQPGTRLQVPSDL